MSRIRAVLPWLVAAAAVVVIGMLVSFMARQLSRALADAIIFVVTFGGLLVVRKWGG